MPVEWILLSLGVALAPEQISPGAGKQALEGSSTSGGEHISPRQRSDRGDDASPGSVQLWQALQSRGGYKGGDKSSSGRDLVQDACPRHGAAACTRCRQAHRAFSFSVPWLSKGSQHRGYLLGFYFSQFPFITIGQKHLISLPKRGLGEMVGFQFNNLPWLEMKALRWLAQYDSHRLCLTGL